jgi:GT2 family glycosyltransferase
VVNWNGKELLQDCLGALQQQVYRCFTVILVDNGSNDGSVEFVNSYYPDIKTISLSNNVGFSAANNIAIKTVNTRYVALLNNDAVPHPSWLKELVETLETHPHVGFVASKMLFYDNPEIIDRAGDSYTKAGAGLFRGRGTSSDNYSKQEWIFGACAAAALYRTQMLRDIGLFDKDFFLVYEDVDLSFRAQLRGYQCLYVPEAVVHHKVSSSIIYDSPTSVYYGHRNLEWVYIKNMPAGLILKTIFPHLIYDMAAFFFFAARGRSKDFIKAKWDALKGLKKALKKRRHIQRSRIVDDDYVWSLLEKELLLPRLTGRLRKN